MSWLPPFLFGTVSQNYLRWCFPGLSPQFCSPNKTSPSTFRLCFFFFSVNRDLNVNSTRRGSEASSVIPVSPVLWNRVCTWSACNKYLWKKGKTVENIWGKPAELKSGKGAFYEGTDECPMLKISQIHKPDYSVSSHKRGAHQLFLGIDSWFTEGQGPLLFIFR